MLHTLPPQSPSRRRRRYQIYSKAEAVAYLAHPLLGPRYLAVARAVTAHLAAGRPVTAVMGGVGVLAIPYLPLNNSISR